MSYIASNRWVTCDRCSWKRRSSDVSIEWDGLVVCTDTCLDIRPYEMTPPVIWPEGVGIVNSRPPQANVFANPGPVNTVAPVITGSTAVNSLLTCSTGTWTGATSYRYEWCRDTVPIVGQTSSTYRTSFRDLGFEITCQVTAVAVSGQTIITTPNFGPIVT